MNKEKTIYIKLLNEEIEVWRPVLAREVDCGYKILDCDYDPDDEQWEFMPGQVVLVKKDIKQGFLKAVKLII